VLACEKGGEKDKKKNKKKEKKEKKRKLILRGLTPLIKSFFKN